MCGIFDALGISHILIWGDSMSMGMYMSLINKIGSKNIRREGAHDLFYNYLICPHSNASSSNQERLISIMGSREDPAVAKPIEFSDRTKAFLADSSSKGRLLGIFNIGSHYKAQEHYEQHFDDLLGTFHDRWETQYRSTPLTLPVMSDLIFFRTTPSGHTNIQPGGKLKYFDWATGQRVTPLKSLNDFKITQLYSWDLFIGFNNYTRTKIREQRCNNTGCVMLLDVVNMTQLRRDGHADGLHYLNPGPVDWWNHLLFTYLQNIANKPATSQRCILGRN